MVVDDGTIQRLRAVKVPGEVQEIRSVQRANEAAMASAINLIRAAEVRDGLLVLGGESLTAERIRAECHVTLLAHGCRAADTIVACGEQTAQPHQRGTGPLAADQPIVIDIFPEDELSGYFAHDRRLRANPRRKSRHVRSSPRGKTLRISGPGGCSGAEVHQAVANTSPHGDTRWRGRPVSPTTSGTG